MGMSFGHCWDYTGTLAPWLASNAKNFRICRRCKMQGKETINQSHKSYNVSDQHPTMHHFVTEFYTYVHISVINCRIVRYRTGALWVCSTGLFGFARNDRQDAMPCSIHFMFLTADYPGIHGDVIKWRHFPRYWPFVRGIHRSLVNSPHKGQWRGALMFSLICVRINAGWANNGDAGDLRRHLAHYDVIVI